MRLNRLDLTRYGKFTDAVFDFGSRPIGSPDLHVIYGPNEAGKSTTFNAVLDLVFGIGHSSKYGFLHPYSSMRLGGNMHVGGREREFVRIKRLQNSLLDSDERTIADTEILADLGGIDRAGFSTMFSLDEETLKGGGESILASKGDLGELLFSASAGLSDLSKQLGDIRATADGFYRSKARNTQLGALKSRLAELKQKREELDLQANAFARMKSDLVDRERQYQQALDLHSTTQRRSNEINRVLRALPTMTRLAGHRAQLMAMAVVAEAPRSWKDDLSEMSKDGIELRVKMDAAARTIEGIEREIAEVTDPAEVLLLAGRVDDLVKTLEPRHVTAEVDIPKLRGRIAGLSVETLLLQLGRSGEQDPARLVLDAATVGRFRGLINARSGVDARLEAATKELARINRALSEEAEAYDSFLDYRRPERRRAFETLTAAVKAIGKTEDEIVLRPLVRRRDAVEASLREAVSRLAPWRGTPGELASMAVPSATTLDKWKTKHLDGREAARSAASDIERLQADLGRLDAEIAAIRQSSGEIEEDAAIASRSRRDEAWVSHRQVMTMETALDFERAMHVDDRVVSQRLLHFAETGKLAQLSLTRAVVLADAQSANLRLSTANEGLAKLSQEIGGSLGDVAGGDFLSRDPNELQEWMRGRTAVLQTRDELMATEQEIADVKDRAEAAKEQLISAMKTAGLKDLEAREASSLITIAEAELDRFNLAMDQAERLERLNTDRIERERVLAEAKELDAGWNSKWQQLCAACWFNDQKPAPDVDAVNGILPILEKLASAIEAKDGFIDRIQKMEKDSAVFQQAVRDLCAALEIRNLTSFNDMVRAIGERLKAAERDRDRITHLTGALNSAREQERELLVSREILASRIAEMTTFFGCETMDEVEACVELSTTRQAARVAIADLERELVDITGDVDVIEAEERLSSADRDALEIELEGLKPILQNHEETCRDAYHELSTLQKTLDAVGGDAAVAQVEEQRRTTLVEIEERAGNYLELRIGIAAAEQALKLYRDRHRSGMMARASEAFRTISRGAYTGVAAQPGKDGEVLMALQAAGGSMSADTLSRGARFQLYLALRVAGYHEFVAARPPVPFVADDIMETFDDFRAEETFKLFAGMAQHGQVIYLTHHRHLTDIARKVCPSVRIHDFEEVQRTARLDGIAAE